MAQTSTLQVTLPQEVVEFVQTKVASGEYSSESEVIREGLAALRDKDAGFEKWAREIAVPAYDRLVADPSRGVSLDRVRADIDSRLRSSGSSGQ